MKIFGTILLAFCALLSADAQTQICSESFKLSRDLSGVAVAGTNDQNFYTVEVAKKIKALNLVCRTTGNMAVKWSKAIPMPSGTVEHEFESFLKLDSAFFLFTSAFSKESEQFQIFCTKFDNSGEIVGVPALVHYTIAEGRADAPKFGYALSPDKSKILVFFDPPFERKNTDPVAFKMYGTDLELIMEKDLVLPYKQDILQVHNFLVDNNGNIFMMSGRNSPKKDTGIPPSLGGRYALFYYNYMENRLKEYDVNLKDKHLLSAKFLITSNQEIIVSGYYSDEVRNVANGTFFFLIGAGGGAVKAGAYMPFPTDFNAKFIKENEQQANQSIKDFYLDELILTDDGGVLLIGEQYYVSETSEFEPLTGRIQIENRHNYDNVLITKLEPNGRQSWNVKIPKRQYSLSATNECSYACYLNDSGVVFYFNDNSENQDKLLALPDGEATAWTGAGKSVVTACSVSMDGQYERKTLPNTNLMLVDLSSHVIQGEPILAIKQDKMHKFCVIKK
jgi:hypothetical protein